METARIFLSKLQLSFVPVNIDGNPKILGAILLMIKKKCSKKRLASEFLFGADLISDPRFKRAEVENPDWIYEVGEELAWHDPDKNDLSLVYQEIVIRVWKLGQTLEEILQEKK